MFTWSISQIKRLEWFIFLDIHSFIHLVYKFYLLLLLFRHCTSLIIRTVIFPCLILFRFLTSLILILFIPANSFILCILCVLKLFLIIIIPFIITWLLHLLVLNRTKVCFISLDIWYFVLLVTLLLFIKCLWSLLFYIKWIIY